MNKLSIKLKMSIWYGGLVGVLLLVFFTIGYNWLSRTMYMDLENKMLETANQIAIELTQTSSDGKIVIPTAKLEHFESFAVIDKHGKLVYNRSHISWIDESPYRKNDYWDKEIGGKKWDIYDKWVVGSDGKLIAVVRICSLKTATAAFLLQIAAAMSVSGIILVMLAFLGGYLIAKRSLAPISKITKTAQEIENGDLSKRIYDVPARDEVGQLVKTFNSMLEHLELSFDREKQFALNASHELRTPVAVIMNQSELLIHHNEKKDPETAEACQSILFESQRMHRIISQLLILIRGEEGMYRPNMEIIDVSDVILNVIEELGEYSIQQHVRISFQKSGDILLQADQTMMTQLFLNLIENAIKYSKPEGFVNIDITEMENMYRITVRDNGIGIDEKDIPFIFDRFFRADKSRDRSGTGLGLSIVKWIVDTGGGSITVQSRIGEGTEFILLFPKENQETQ